MFLDLPCCSTRTREGSRDKETADSRRASNNDNHTERERERERERDREKIWKSYSWILSLVLINHYTYMLENAWPWCVAENDERMSVGAVLSDRHWMSKMKQMEQLPPLQANSCHHVLGFFYLSSVAACLVYFSIGPTVCFVLATVVAVVMWRMHCSSKSIWSPIQSGQ